MREVAVCSARSADGRTGLRAYVVPVGPAVDSELLTAQLLAAARARLTGHTVPKSVTFVSALPRTATGKLRRFALRAIAARTPLEEDRK